MKKLIAFYGDTTGLVDEGRATGEALYIVIHNVLVEELMKRKLDKWTVRLIENWLNC